MERLEFDLLFRWFVGLGIDDPASLVGVISLHNGDEPALTTRRWPTSSTAC